MNGSPGRASRRAFLSRAASAVGLAGVAATVSLAGCSGDGPTSGGDDSGDGGTGGETPTPTPGGLRLDTLDVGGSPGEPVVVEPPGQVALLDFFATWCAPCKPQMAELRAVKSQHPDLHLLSVSQEQDPEVIRDFWVEYEGTWPVAQDTQLEAFQKYDITRIPTKVLLDAEGSEVWRHSGLSAAEDIVEEIEGAQS